MGHRLQPTFSGTMLGTLNTDSQLLLVVIFSLLPSREILDKSSILPRVSLWSRLRKTSIDEWFERIEHGWPLMAQRPLGKIVRHREAKMRGHVLYKANRNECIEVKVFLCPGSSSYPTQHGKYEADELHFAKFNVK